MLFSLVLFVGMLFGLLWVLRLDCVNMGGVVGCMYFELFVVLVVE